MTGVAGVGGAGSELANALWEGMPWGLGRVHEYSLAPDLLRPLEHDHMHTEC